MPLQFRTKCSHCAITIKVGDHHIGQIVRCPACKQKFELTNLSSTNDGDTSVSIAETLDGKDDGTLGNSNRLKESPESGVKLGRFTLQKVLGQGAFGKVYRAFDPQLDRFLAIKVPTFSTDDTKRVQRFLTEAKAAARLRHPNIVPTFESGMLDGQYFIAAQFIQGQPLNEVIKSKKYDRRESIGWIAHLADAIYYAHQNQIVHRDIKPHNIMLDEQGQPQLMDFGLARRGDEESTQTTDGTLLGTPAYMPPEQARGALNEIGPWSDQYSLGVILYEVLTGQRPFQGEPHAVISQVLNDAAPLPRTLDRSIPRDLESICRKAMAKLPTDRYVNCEELADDLRRWLRGESTRAKPLSALKQFWRWSKKNPVIGAAAMVCLAAIGSVAILAIAVAIDQRKRNEEAENALHVADQRKNEALQANATLANNYKLMEQTVQRRNEAILDAEQANINAQQQAELANKGRRVAKELLLANQQQQLRFEKQRLHFPEALRIIDESLSTAHELGMSEAEQALSLDKAFIKSISVTDGSSADSGQTPIPMVRLTDELALSPKGAMTWRLYRIQEAAEFGEPFRFELPVRLGKEASGTERMIGAALTGSSLSWITVRPDADPRFLGVLEHHEVQLATGAYTLRKGPQFIQVATDSLTVPVWFAQSGKHIAFRNREKASEIIIADVSNFETTTSIESPESTFYEAAFGRSDDAFAIVDQTETERFAFTIYPIQGTGLKKKVVLRGADSITLESRENLVVVTKGRTAEARSLDRGISLAQFPFRPGPVIARRNESGMIAVLNNQSLFCKNGKQLGSLQLDQVGHVDDFLISESGDIVCYTADRQFVLNTKARLIIGSSAQLKQSTSLTRLFAPTDIFSSFTSVDLPHLPDGNWRFANFTDRDRVLLLESELLKRFQVNGKQVIEKRD